MFVNFLKTQFNEEILDERRVLDQYGTNSKYYVPFIDYLRKNDKSLRFYTKIAERGSKSLMLVTALAPKIGLLSIW